MSGAYPVPASRARERALTQQLSRGVARQIAPALRVSALAAAGLAVEYAARALVAHGARSAIQALRRPVAATRTVVTEYVVVERTRRGSR